MQVYSNLEDPNNEISQENLEVTREATDAKGRRLEIIPIEQPMADHYEDTRLTLSYLNFCFVKRRHHSPGFRRN